MTKVRYLIKKNSISMMLKIQIYIMRKFFGYHYNPYAAAEFEKYYTEFMVFGYGQNPMLDKARELSALIDFWEDKIWYK